MGNWSNYTQTGGTTTVDQDRNTNALNEITGYSSATVGTGTVVNEVFRQYNEWGMLGKEYQNPAGKVLDNNGDVISGTPCVTYDYDDSVTAGVSWHLPVSGTQPAAVPYLRQTDVIYPDGREVDYTYGAAGSDSDELSRVAAITESQIVNIIPGPVEAIDLNVSFSLGSVPFANDTYTFSFWAGLDGSAELRIASGIVHRQH